MGAIDFRTIDLNLLAPSRVLLVERHVTRSAEKLVQRILLRQIPCLHEIGFRC